MNKKEMVGIKLGRLTILSSFKKGRRIYYKCKCECKKSRTIRSDYLPKSCGCLNRENVKNRRSIKSRIRFFWSRINKTDKCWLWIGAKLISGYGYLYLQNGKQSRKKVLAHRFSYILHYGKIPNGKELDHICRIKNCVNPKHLEPVTSKENTYRGTNPKIIIMHRRILTGFCKNGHSVNEWNKKDRRCRLCTNAYKMKLYYKNKNRKKRI